ncbi:MAG: hypothetical protein GXO02_05395, partial [Epsilonproteobacteria bacterium]|nr:hypothetical protein [Campylobacterota bacterium]
LDGKISTALIPILKNIFKKYKVNRVIYVNGPGSYLGIKLTYIALETIRQIEDFEILSTLAFELNSNKPIKGMGKLYFIKEKENIITKRFEDEIKNSFFMPKSIDNLKVSKDYAPSYYMGAL